MRLIFIAAALLSQAVAAAPAYKVVDRIPGPDGGWDYVRVDAANNRLLVARGSSVMAVDLATRAVTPGLAPGVRLHDALPVDGEMLVTNGGTATAVFVDARTGATIATVPTGKGPDAATLDPRSGLVLVMDHAGGQVTLIDPKAHAAVATIDVGGDLEAAVVSSGRAYVNVEDRNQIAVIDIAKRTVIARWALPGCDAPTGIALISGGRRLISACDGSSVIVDIASGKVVQVLPTGHGADGVAYDARRDLAFVPAGRDGTLAVIALGGKQARIIQMLPTQASARTIAIDERTGRLYLPAATPGPVPSGGGRASPMPGSFVVLVVG
jgi:DNA-binding beta-propeller fold protein YncE